MKQYIDKAAVVAEINKLTRKNELYFDENSSDSVRFQKIGAYSVLCDLRHFIDTIEVKEVDLKEIIKSHFDIKNINDVKITTTGENLLNLAMRINKFVMNNAFEQYRQIGENTGNKSLDEEIEETIKMNDMWCGLMPNTLIKYTARHFFELGIKAQKGEER